MPRYQLSISAVRLPKGGWRTPNAYAVVKVTGGEQNGTTLGKTDIVHCSRNPEFTKVIFIETSSSRFLPIKISIYNDRNHAELASASFEATEIHASKGHIQVQKCSNGAEILASMEQSIQGPDRGNVILQLRGLDIKNVEPGLMGLGRSDPYFELAKKNADHMSGIVRWDVVYRSKHINDHLNPFWDKFSIGLEELCYCDSSWPLKLSVWDFQENGKHRVIGEYETTLELLSQQIAIRGNADRDRALEILGQSKSDPGTLKTRGLIVVLQVDVERDAQHEGDQEENRDPLRFSV